MGNVTTLSREAAQTVVDIALDTAPIELLTAFVSMLEPFGYKIDGDEIITPTGVILPAETVKRHNKRLAEMHEDPSCAVEMTDELMEEMCKPVVDLSKFI
ncbi:MAG: hypothetical protein LBL41_02505 [Bifidobacteriaceae bacterium]|nr:hypothetical protein [Bifidobacteriaceae bacterium]